jgi:phage baseplate assembly protein gpV
MNRLLATLALAVLVAGLAPELHAEGELGAVEPSAEEQFGIWTLNKARHDPPAYGAKIGVDLSSVAPQPPLAVSRLLTGSARFHAKEMLDNDYFAHTSAVTGEGPNQMAVNNGYDLFGMGLDHAWGTDNNIESLAFGINQAATFEEALALLIEDKDVPSLGHRVHLLAMQPFYAAHREIGCGRASGVTAPNQTSYYYAIHTGNVSEADRFLTGVVFADADGDAHYDKGEGIGGVTIDAGGGRTTTSMAEGGWSIQVPQGQYSVTCSGGTFVGTATANVGVTASNVEIDFRSSASKGEVDFGGVSGPDVSFTATPSSGPAPLDVTFDAASSPDGAAFSWDFGDGATATGDPAAHTFTQPGLYSVHADADDAAGTGHALAVVAVDGPAGAGPGTTAPSSRALIVKAFTAKAVFHAAGRDAVTFKCTIEMPAGWTPGLSDVVVDVAGARKTFALADADKVTDEAGDTFKLKYVNPDPLAGPLPVGVVGKVTVTLNGDLAADLLYAGFRDATEKRTLAGVPFAVMLGELAYTGTAQVALKSKATRKASGALVR